jgi:hypothetical protein
MTTPRRPRTTKAAAGEQVLQHYLSAAPGRLTKPELVDQTGLSPNQVYAGTLWVKETGASREARPFSWTRKDGGGFTGESADSVAYVLAQSRRAYNALGRLLTSTVDPQLQTEQGDAYFRLVQNQFQSIIQTLEILQQEAPAPPSPPVPA